jgi:CAAX protease family protein
MRVFHYKMGAEQTLSQPMSNELQPPPPPGPSPIATAEQAPSQPGLIAPLWHTVVIVGLLLVNSFAGSSKLSAVHGSPARILLYAGTFITQLILVLIIWFGIRRRGVRMRDLIGGRWKTVEDFLLDLALAGAFLVVSLLLLALVRIALGMIDLHNLEKTKQDTLRMLGPIAPHTYLEAGLFVLLSVFAGLFEEIIFRGYLQRQLGALAQNAFIGIFASAVIFGLAHGYQGARMMLVLGLFGVFFGLLAHFRKSLRPGMMAHAFQDSLSGIALFRLVRS